MAEEEEESSSKTSSTTKAKIFVPNLCLDTMKAAAQAPSSSRRLSSSIPSSPVGLRKAASVRQNCLCSPTTHAGSFRCRYHRNNNNNSLGGLTRNGMSVGSKLSELAGKTTEICLVAGHHHKS